MNGKPNRGGATDDEVRAYIRRMILKRDALLYETPFSQKRMDEVFVIALDGDEPEEFPELCEAFFKGHANPVLVGQQAMNRWEKENSL
jgi:hypothetical protein